MECSVRDLKIGMRFRPILRRGEYFSDLKMARAFGKNTYAIVTGFRGTTGAIRGIEFKGPHAEGYYHDGFYEFGYCARRDRYN